jgi:hypothetical protein
VLAKTTQSTKSGGSTAKKPKQKDPDPEIAPKIAVRILGLYPHGTGILTLAPGLTWEFDLVSTVKEIDAELMATATVSSPIGLSAAVYKLSHLVVCL